MNDAKREVIDGLVAAVRELPEEWRRELMARLVERRQPHPMSPGIVNENVWDRAVSVLGVEDTTRYVIGVCEEPSDERE